MATVTTHNLEQDRSRIHSPLVRLRKYIHTYVSLEGAALVGLFLAAWFWIGMLLDYGFFKLFLLDWVQELPWGVRLGLLLVVGLAVVVLFAVTVFTRLFTDFTDAAVAIVLERRFPKLLGDRLITAVELSDPVAAAGHGYSGDMVRETIHEAAQRVNQLPLTEVFDWKRLVARGVLLVALTGVLYALVGTGFAAVRAVRGQSPALAGFGDLTEASGIWFERNVLLRNTIWPRRSYLEIIDFPENLRIPRESAPPILRVQAWKYVVADPTFPEGWRLLTWTDLKDRPELAGDVPELPGDWTPQAEAASMSVDEIEQTLDAFPIRTHLPSRTLPARWCIASDQVEGGWRPLMWKDLTKEKLGGLNVPGLPGDWDPKATAALIAGGAGLVHGGPMGAVSRILVGPKYISLRVDEVAQALENAEREKKPGLEAVRMVFAHLERLASIRDTLDRVDARTAERSMGRTMRKLVIPANVTLVYRSVRATTTNTLTPLAGNQYTGGFGELKETVSFTLQGEDYVTARRQITVVDRPRLERLESEEERPAYLYYRPARDGSPADLRGLRQRFQGVPMSVSGDATTIEVPAGTTLTLTGTITKPLSKVGVVVESKDERNFVGGKPQALDDGRSFRMHLADVRREQRFTFQFTDDDEVLAERKVIVTPKEDTSPRVREFNPDEVIRRGKEGFIVAVGCRIPFKGKVRDDNGLAAVRYACRVIPGDFLSEQKLRALDGVAAVPLLAPGFGTELLALAYFTGVHREMSKATRAETSAEQLIELPAFAQALEANRLHDGRREFLEKGTILSLLRQKRTEPYRKLLNDFSINPDPWTNNDEDATTPNRWVRAQDARAPLGADLPLWALTYDNKALKDPDDTKPQKRYFVEVRLVAEDTYLEGDLDPKTKLPAPHSSASGETFTFVVVPENELLSKIAEEEEVRYHELQKAFKPLPENLGHMRDMHFTLSAGNLQAAELNAFIARCDTLGETLKTSQQDTRTVYQAYERILRELRTNQLRDDVVNKVYKTIYLPLYKVSETQFDRTAGAVIDLRKALDNNDLPLAARTEAARPKAAFARAQLTQLVSDMNAILSAMEGLAKINELIAELARIEKQEADLESAVKRVRMRRLKEALQD